MKNLSKILLIVVLFISMELNAQDKKPITQEIMKVLVKDGVDAAIVEYNELKKESASKFDFSEKHLRNLALEIIEDGGSSQDAEKLFALNSESFPESSEAYYYLGFINYEIGNDDEALLNLKMAYEIDENNKSARDLIQRIEDPKVYDTYQYVCGPCFCAHHDYKFKEPGTCIQCGMTLVKAD